MDFDINSDVPMPIGKNSGKYVNLVRKMKPGESVFFDSVQKKENFRFCARRIGCHIVTRREGAGFRAWLVTAPNDIEAINIKQQAQPKICGVVENCVNYPVACGSCSRNWGDKFINKLQAVR